MKTKEQWLNQMEKDGIFNIEICLHTMHGYVSENITKEYYSDYLKYYENKNVTLEECLLFGVYVNQIQRLFLSVESLKNGYEKHIKDTLYEYGSNIDRNSENFIKLKEYELYDVLFIDEYLFYIYNYNKNFEEIVPYKDIKKYLDDLLNYEFVVKAHENSKAAQFLLNEEKYIEKKKRTNVKKGIVYLIKIDDREQYKIGVTTNLNKRMNQLGTKMPFELEVIAKIESDDIYKLEEQLHEKFKDKNINGEWFELKTKDIKYIKSLSEV